MAKFLNTSATTFYLEDLIKRASKQLILISPYLKFNERIKELLADKDRMKMEVRLVYGKSELAPQEINWLRPLEFLRTSFCQNLHAKCYLNEDCAIITSMNLYDFSQVNNNEMGVLVERESDPEVYRETYEEAQRLFRIGQQVRLSAETIDPPAAVETASEDQDEKSFDKLSTSRMAKQRGLATSAFVDQLIAKQFVEKQGDQLKLTEVGKQAGGEAKYSKKFGPYMIWPKNLFL